MSKLPTYEHLVHYYETDQMGVVHHSNYIRWFEEARVDVFDKIGMGYKECEEQGIISPVTAVSCQYKTSARFHDEVIVELKFTKFTGIRLYVSYVVSDKATGEIRATGTSEHCFVSPDGKILSIKKSYPDLYTKLSYYIEDNA